MGPNKKLNPKENSKKIQKIPVNQKKNQLKLPSVQYTKDLLLSAVRNKSFLTADNNKSFVSLSTPRPHVPARVVILPRKSLQSPLRPPVIPCHTMASNPRSTIPSHTMASNPRLTIPSLTMASNPRLTIPSLSMASDPRLPIPSLTMASDPRLPIPSVTPAQMLQVN